MTLGEKLGQVVINFLYLPLTMTRLLYSLLLSLASPPYQDYKTTAFITQDFNCLLFIIFPATAKGARPSSGLYGGEGANPISPILQGSGLEQAREERSSSSLQTSRGMFRTAMIKLINLLGIWFSVLRPLTS